MTASAVNHPIKYNGDNVPRPIPGVNIVNYVQPKMVVTKDSRYFQIHGMDITDSFDKLMKTDYYDAGGEKYVRSEPTTGEDLRARDASIQERARTLVGEGQAGRRSLPEGIRYTPSSPQKEGSVNDAVQHLTQSPADFKSPNIKSTPSNSGVPPSRLKPGSSRRLEEPE